MLVAHHQTNMHNLSKQLVAYGRRLIVSVRLLCDNLFQRLSQTLKWTPPWSEAILQWRILNESVSRFRLQILSPQLHAFYACDQHCYEQKCPKELEIAGFEFYTSKKRLRYVSIVWTREGKGKRRTVWPATHGQVRLRETAVCIMLA